MLRKLLVLGGAAGSLVLGVVCLPAGMAMAAATAVFAGVAGEDRFSNTPSEEEPATSLPATFSETVPAGYEEIADEIRNAARQRTRMLAYGAAHQLAAQLKDATIELTDTPDQVAWSVYSSSGQLIEHGEVDIPLQD